MDWLLLSNNVSSGFLVIVTWWLAQECSCRGWWPVAILLSAVGFTVLLTGFARNFGVDVRGPIVLTKILLCVAAGVAAYWLRTNADAPRKTHFRRRSVSK